MTSDAAYRAVFRRVVWYPFLLYICAYLDRLNIGFAALAMNRDLGLTPTTFGAANTIFHLGCMVFEVPSNLLLARFGARTSQFRTAVPPRSRGWANPTSAAKEGNHDHQKASGRERPPEEEQAADAQQGDVEGSEPEKEDANRWPGAR